jgi:hypothetical protein
MGFRGGGGQRGVIRSRLPGRPSPGRPLYMSDIKYFGQIQRFVDQNNVKSPRILHCTTIDTNFRATILKTTTINMINRRYVLGLRYP